MADGVGIAGGAALALLAAGVAFVATTCGRPTRAPLHVGRPAAVQRTASAPAPPREVLAPGAIRGSVLLGRHELPDAGRVVTLTRDGAPPATVATDPWGRFRFDDVPAGVPVDLRVEAEGCAAQHIPRITLLPGETRSVGDLALDRPATFRIEVVDDAGRPLAGVAVDAYREPTGPLEDYVERVAPQTADVPAMTQTTDAEGHAVFEVPASQEFTFAASAPGLARRARAANWRRAGVRDEIVLALVRPVRLTGRALGTDGKPVPRAVVLAREEPPVIDERHGTRAEGPGLWTRTDADAEGRFTFEALPPGPTEFRAAAEGGVPASRWEYVDTRGVAEVDVHVEPTGTVAGRVTDLSDGSPVAGATVAVQVDGAAWMTVTGKDGAYTFPSVVSGTLDDFDCAPPGGWTSARLTPPRGPDDRPRVAAGRELRLDWTVRRAAVVEGRVTTSGAPVLGAMVDVLVVPEKLDDARWTTDGRTDADGRFRIEDVPAGTVALCATAPGASDYEARSRFRNEFVKDAAVRALHVFEATLGAPTRRDLDVPLAKGDARANADAEMQRMADRILGARRVTFVCRVRTADGAPLRDARVQVGPAEWAGRRGDPLRFARPVPKDGVAEIVERVQDGEQTFAVAAGDAEHDVTTVADVAVAADATQVEVDVVLQPLPVLAARVVCDGRPVAGALICERRTLVARSAADGTFALRRTSGRYRIAVEAPGCVRREFREIEVPRDDVAELSLDRAEAIEGVVVDAGGKPVGGVTVTPLRRGEVAAPYDGSSWTPSPLAVPVTGEDGRFRLAELASGEFELRIRAAHAEDAAVAQWTSKPVATGSSDVRLVARRASRIAGRVVDPGGKGVARARAVCSGIDEVTEDEDDREVRTGPDGAFGFPGLLEGRYRIDVRAVPRDELAHGRFRMDAGGTDVVLALAPAGILAGVVVAADGRPVARAQVAAARLGTRPEDEPVWDGRMETWTGEDGRFRIAVPPGAAPGARYALSFTTNSRAGDTAVLRGGEDVPAGSLDLVLTAVTGMAVAGTVVTEKGRGVWDADIEVRTKDGSVRRFRTGSDGAFRINGLEPGTADVVVQGPGRVPTLLRGVAIGTVDIEVVLPVGGSITGTLLDAAGEPATGWRVRARRVADPETDLWRTNVRSDGGFAIPGLDEDGEWTLDAIVEAGTAIERSVPLGTAKTGARDLTFKLAK